MYLCEALRKRVAATALVVVVCFATSAGAQTLAEDEAQLSAAVRGDGALYGFAQACKLPREELKALFDRKLEAARAFARSKVPHYKPEDFVADFKGGIQTAQGIVAMTDPHSDAHKKNCEEIQEKVKALLEGP